MIEGLTIEPFIQLGSFGLVAYMFYFYITNISKQLEKNNEAIGKLTETLSILMDRIDRMDRSEKK